MNARAWFLTIVLGGPAAALLLFGPRGEVNVPAGVTVVRYWEKWTGVEAEPMQALVERFNETVGAEHGVWVEYTPISNVDQRLLIATAGGDPPDIAGLFDHALPQYAERDALLPLADLVAEAGIPIDQFKPIWLDICTFDDQLYALPSTPYTVALYYNRALFRKAGLDPDTPPRTIAELEQYSRALTERNDKGEIVRMGFTTAPGMLGWWHWVWPYYFGARYWDGSNVHIDTLATRAAYQWIDERREALGVEDVVAFEATAGAIEGAQNPFLSGQIAMVLQGPWLSNWARRYTPELDYAVAPFPSSTAGRRHAFASADIFVIPRGSPHPEEAMLFLEFLLRQENLEQLCKVQCKISPFKHPQPAFFEGHPNPFIDVFDRMAASPDAFGHPKMPTWAFTTARLLQMHTTILRDRDPSHDPGEVITETQRTVQSYVEAHQAMMRKRTGKSPTEDRR